MQKGQIWRPSSSREGQASMKLHAHLASRVSAEDRADDRQAMMQ